MEYEKEIANIKARNARVELDKKWETSWTRRILIAIFTYVVVVAFLFLVDTNISPFLSAIVPVIGFTLSTLSLKWARRIWEKSHRGIEKQ